MTGLTAFLLARIDEDEDELIVHRVGCRFIDSDTYSDCDCTGPSQLLAECEAKRRIVEMHPTWNGTSFAAGSEFGTEVAVCRRCDVAEPLGHRAYAPCLTLCLLAAPYAGHPDFDPAWQLERKGKG